MHRAVITQLVQSIISRPHHRPACRRKSTRSMLTAPKARLPLNRTTRRTPRMGRNTSRNTPRSLHLRERSKASRHSPHLRQRITTSIRSAPRLLPSKKLHRNPLMRPTVKVRAAGKRSPTKRKIKAPTESAADSMSFLSNLQASPKRGLAARRGCRSSGSKGLFLIEGALRSIHRIRSHQLQMKTRSWLLTVVAAISAFVLLATPAHAGGRKHCIADGNGGYRYYQRGWNGYGYGYCQPYYRPVYYYPAPCYRPVYYNSAPVIVFGFGFR